MTECPYCKKKVGEWAMNAVICYHCLGSPIFYLIPNGSAYWIDFSFGPDGVYVVSYGNFNDTLIPIDFLRPSKGIHVIYDMDVLISFEPSENISPQYAQNVYERFANLKAFL